jgi:hypothetical protein
LAASCLLNVHARVLEVVMYVFRNSSAAIDSGP